MAVKIVQSYGATAKEIRLSKGMTLSDIADDQLSVGTISKFESGQSDLTVTRFVHLLEKLWTTPEEFIYRYFEDDSGFDLNGYRTMGLMLERFMPLAQNFEVEEGTSMAEMSTRLLPIMDKVTELAQNAQDKVGKLVLPFWQVISSYLLARVSGNENLQPHPKFVHEAITYFRQLDTWGEFDIYMFSGFALGMTDDQGLELFKTLQKRARKYLQFRSESNLLFRVTENQFNIAMSRQNYAAAKYYLDTFAANLQYSRNANNNIAWLFDRGWYKLRAGQPEAGVKDMQQALTVVRFLGLEDKNADFSHRFNFLTSQPAGADWQVTSVYFQ